MTNYTQYSKVVIFAAPAQRLDYINRKESVVSAETLQPGTVVQEVDGEFVPSTGEGISYVLDRNHLEGKYADAAYEANDRATAFWPQDGLVLNVLTSAGLDIAEDDALYIGEGGALTTEAESSTSGPYGYAAETINTGDAAELVAVKLI